MPVHFDKNPKDVWADKDQAKQNKRLLTPKQKTEICETYGEEYFKNISKVVDNTATAQDAKTLKEVGEWLDKFWYSNEGSKTLNANKAIEALKQGTMPE